MGFKAKFIDSGSEPHTYWIFGELRIRWSHYWWLSVILVGLAALTLFWPITEGGGSSSTRSVSCGSVFSSTVTVEADGEVVATEEIPEGGTCETLQDARSNRALAWLTIALLPAWLGRRDIASGDNRPEHVAAVVCIGMSLMLLIGPHELSNGRSCGSPLFVAVEDGDSVKSDGCLVERPSRVSWAVLWGVAAIPFAMAAARSRDD